jgi:hypothetical protein
MEIFFITKIIFNLPKSDIIVGDTFGVLFQVQKYDTIFFWKARERIEILMEKKNLHLFWNARGSRLKVPKK